jgi:hypothetical protein
MTTKEALAKWVKLNLKKKRTLFVFFLLGRKNSTKSFRSKRSFTLWTISTN